MHPSLRRAALPALAVAVGYAASEIVTRTLAQWLEPFTHITARVVAQIVAWCGMTVERAGVILSHPAGFACEIDTRCLALAPLFVFAALLLVPSVPGRGIGVIRELHRVNRTPVANNPDPPTWHRRLRRLLLHFAIGSSLLVLLNLVRLVNLYWVGVAFPGQFALAHDVIWPLVIVAALLFLWWQAVTRDPSSSPRSRAPAGAASGAVP